jgi:hypothetical protein
MDAFHKVTICIEHSKLGFRIPQMAWRVAEEARYRSRSGECPFSVPCGGSLDGCILTFRAVNGSTASRPVVKQYDNADPNMMRHELAA